MQRSWSYPLALQGELETHHFLVPKMEGYYQKPFDVASDLPVFVNIASKTFPHLPLDPLLPDSPVLGLLFTSSGDPGRFPNPPWSGNSRKPTTNVGSYFHQEEAMLEQSVSESLLSHFQNTLPPKNPAGASCCDQHTK